MPYGLGIVLPNIISSPIYIYFNPIFPNYLNFAYCIFVSDKILKTIFILLELLLYLISILLASFIYLISTLISRWKFHFYKWQKYLSSGKMAITRGSQIVCQNTVTGDIFFYYPKRKLVSTFNFPVQLAYRSNIVTWLPFFFLSQPKRYTYIRICIKSLRWHTLASKVMLSYLNFFFSAGQNFARDNRVQLLRVNVLLYRVCRLPCVPYYNLHLSPVIPSSYLARHFNFHNFDPLRRIFHSPHAVIRRHLFLINSFLISLVR